jgi:hypothetical protein
MTGPLIRKLGNIWSAVFLNKSNLIGKYSKSEEH